MSQPTAKHIDQFLAAHPKCTRGRAKRLLKVYNNDVKKAISRYHFIEKNTGADSASSSDSESVASYESDSADESEHEPEKEHESKEDKHGPKEDKHGSKEGKHGSKQDKHDSKEDKSGPKKAVVLPQNDEDAFWPALMRFPKPVQLVKGGTDGSGKFELENLIGAIQAGISVEQVRDYLAYYNEKVVRSHMNALVDDYPAIFYIVETHNVEMIKLWIKYGGDPNSTCGESDIPLLAFVVLRGSRTLKAVTRTVETLLGLGASPSSFPEAFYKRYDRDLPEEGLDTSKLPDIEDENKKWCTPDFGQLLTATLNVTMRYCLDRASRVVEPSIREKDVTLRQTADGVLRLYQAIIAQPIATRWLMQKLLVYLALQSGKPLVLVFAGPSGHGKTELAKMLGSLLGVDMESVDCTVMNSETDLFGGRPPYQNWQEGSNVNNFLCTHDGKRSIVFMDEFEKTNEQIHNALLIPFQEGKYDDRRAPAKRIDCSKTIWILATNRFDATIHQYHEDNKKGLESDDQILQDRLVKKLCSDLRKESIAAFGAPLTGRIKDIVPFLRFSDAEATIVAHKGFMEYEDEVANSVKLSDKKEEDRYIGNVRIEVKNDSSTFSHIARTSYLPQTGARSIFDGLEREVIEEVTGLYLKDGDDLDEDQPETLFEIGMGKDKEVEIKLIPQPDEVEE